MRKDTSIWMLVAQLAAAFGGKAFQLVDHWDADFFAIGFTGSQDEERLVYVSTFGKPPGVLAYDCEGPDSDFGGEPRQREQADFDQLVWIMARHLGMAPIERH